MDTQSQRLRSIPYLKLMGSFFLLLGLIPASRLRTEKFHAPHAASNSKPLILGSTNSNFPGGS
jgi:hypothetical protein